METFEIIKNIRTSNRLTQSDFGRILKCDRYRVADIERGKTTPTIEDIKIISKEFNISSDYLLGISDVQSTDTDVKMICEYTGLSERAVEILKLYKNIMNDTIDTINYLIEKDGEFFLQIEKIDVKNENNKFSKLAFLMDGIKTMDKSNCIELLSSISVLFNLYKIDDEIITFDEHWTVQQNNTNDTDLLVRGNFSDLFSKYKLSKKKLLEYYMLNEINDNIKRLFEKRKEELNKDGVL